MAGLVDHEAVLADFEAFLIEDGRQSHGTDFLTRKLAELRARHRIDQGAESAVLRRFGSHLTDVFLGLVPDPVTSDPLTADDPRASAAMDDGAAIPSHQEREVPCQTNQQPRFRETPDPAAGSTERKIAAAATC